MAVFRVAKPAGILGAGGLVRLVKDCYLLCLSTMDFVWTSTSWLRESFAVAGSDIRLLAMCNC